MNSHREKMQNIFQEYGKACIVFLSIVIALISTSIAIRESLPHKLSVSFLDVGQGDSILVQTPSGHGMIIDGGPTNAVLTQIEKQMNYFNREIDVMIATHGDADHVTGLIPILEKYKVQNIVRSPVESQSGIFDDLQSHIRDEAAEVYVGQKGDEIDFGDGVIARVLYPNKTISPTLDTNDASVSIVLTYGGHSFLLTGDLTTKYEPQLIQSVLPKQMTVYKAGHHGSKTSSGEQLLSYIKPEYAVISAGADNRYGHPNAEAVARLEKYSKEILSTTQRGTITFTSDGRMIEVKTSK